MISVTKLNIVSLIYCTNFNKLTSFDYSILGKNSKCTRCLQASLGTIQHEAYFIYFYYLHLFKIYINDIVDYFSNANRANSTDRMDALSSHKICICPTNHSCLIYFTKRESRSEDNLCPKIHTYLGVCFHLFSTFSNAINKFYEKALKAMYGIYRVCFAQHEYKNPTITL